MGERLLYYLYGVSFVAGRYAYFLLLVVQVVNVFMFLGTMSLNALDRPKDAFWITVVAAIANICLTLFLFRVLGITGAGIATLIAMTLNALGALILLSRTISIKFDVRANKKHILCLWVYGSFSAFHYFVLPLTHVAVVLVFVIFGAGIYLLVLLKLDREIHDELKSLSVNLGVRWPEWI